SLTSFTLPVVIPPAFGLKGVGFETYTGDGPISYWNNYVGAMEMAGHASFTDPPIGISVTQTPALVTPKLPALLQYPLGLEPPPPEKTSKTGPGRRVEELSNGAAGCARFHTPPLFTDVLSGPVRWPRNFEQGVK